MGVSYSDFESFVKEHSEEIETGFDSLRESLEQTATNEAQRAQAIGQYFYNKMQNAINNAQAAAAQSAATNNPNAAAWWNAQANAWSDIADQRAIQGDTNWVKGLLSNADASNLKALGTLGTIADAAGTLQEILDGDFTYEDFAEKFGQVAGALLFTLAVTTFLAPVGWFALLLAGVAGTYFGGQAYLNLATRNLFADAQAALFRRDPLTLDLDGDGLETVGADLSGVTFDHDGDGIETGTGWVQSDDGFLVLDRNANGSIDTGAELFGDSTPLAGGGQAEDGFAALAQEDTNSDGVVNSSDANWSDLRVWRDLNQDGSSQTGELFTLASLGIAGINVEATEHSRVLEDGNRIADLGTFVRADGSSGAMGNIGDMADIDLTEDTWHREFTEPIPLVQGAAGLPKLQGAGKVRDLREAASQSSSLFGVLVTYSQASTRAQQMDLLDDLLEEWGATAGMETMLERATSALAEGMNPYGWGLKWDAIGRERKAHFTTTDPNTGHPTVDPEWLQIVAEFERKLYILEAFNGRHFFTFPWETPEGAAAIEGAIFETTTDPNTGQYTETGGIRIGLSQGQIDLLDRAYQELKLSVYDGLVMQTRFRPLLESVLLRTNSANGMTFFDFSTLEGEMESRITQNSVLGLQDLIDFNRHTRSTLARFGWEGDEMLESKLRTLSITTPLQEMYDEMGVKFQIGSTTITSTDGNDILVLGSTGTMQGGGSGDDTIFAGGGIDRINGGLGNDRIYGGDGDDGTHNWFDYQNNGGGLYGDHGDDVIDGGAGNDYMEGGAGNDVYIFGAGYGQDKIRNYNGYGGWSEDEALYSNDELFIKADIPSEDVTARRVGMDLVLTVAGSTDSVTIISYFGGNDIDNMYRLDNIKFADGTIWDADAILEMVSRGTSGADTLLGVDDADDVLEGMGGADTLEGGAGNDLLLGGDGNDTLRDNAGDDIIDGGAGDDYSRGYFGNDTWILGRGDGHDTVQSYDLFTGYVLGDASTTTDAVEFRADVLSSDVRAERSGNDLVLTIRDTGDSITLDNHFLNGTAYTQYGVDEVRFDNGTIWDRADIHAQAMIGTAQADEIFGFVEDDVIQGLGGSDELHGGAGNDTISGGTGDDLLNGNAGSDTYIFNIGDGQDEIQNYVGGSFVNPNPDAATATDILEFGAGILAAEVTASRDGDDLVLTLDGGTDSVTVSGHFGADLAFGHLGIDEVRFADGTIWDKDDLAGFAVIGTSQGEVMEGMDDRADAMEGLGGNDILNGHGGNDDISGGEGVDNLQGHAGDDVLDGGAGNDTLIGGTGNDTYVFGIGDGQDLVENFYSNSMFIFPESDASTTTDAVLFKSGILETDITAQRILSDLVLSITSTGEKITVLSHFSGDSSTAQVGVDEVRFADGTTWSRAQIASKVLAGTGSGDTIVGLIDDDTIEGFGGNDSISGRDGNDTLLGGTGNDVLLGENGNDQLFGGADTDTLTGAAGDDVHSGDAGNDHSTGGTGHDTYLFGAGDGQDTVRNHVYNHLNGNIFLESDAATTTDIVRFKAGVASTGVTARRNSNDLVLTITGTSDTITIMHHFSGDTSNSQLGIDEVRFEDGTVWNRTQIASKALEGTSSGETITGLIDDDYLEGLGGNDSIYGRAGHDTLLGGDGVDSLFGEDGNDTLYGGIGNDNLYGQVGNDILDGGTGNDALRGATGNDTVLFGDGDGQDTIHGTNYGVAETDAATTTDVLQFKAGILTSEVTARRNSADIILSIAGSSDTVTIGGQFQGDIASTQVGVDEVRFDDGTVWTRSMLAAMVLLGTSTGDTLTGFNSSDDTMEGFAGNDTMYGRSGNDTMYGGDGNDSMQGDDGDDALEGGIGGDSLYGQNGNDTLKGGADQDIMYGAAGDDVLEGGTGNDTLITGGQGNDTYYFSLGDGQDTVFNQNYSSGLAETDAATTTDKIVFKAGVASTDVTVRRIDSNLRLAITGTSDYITVSNHFQNDSPSSTMGIDEVRFDDGTVWNQATLAAMALLGTSAGETLTGYAAADDTIDGQAGNDTIWGRSGHDTLSGGLGGDTLRGEDGNDTLNGGADADALWGAAGDDIIDGGTGNDTLLTGGLGNDTYYFGLGDGQDMVYNGNYSSGTAESDAAATTDKIIFRAGIATTDVTVRRIDGNLRLSINGTSDYITVNNHFYQDSPSSGAGIDEVRFNDGTIWTQAQISSWVLDGTSAAENLYGYASTDDVIDGLAGADFIYGRTGNDLLRGGDGADRLYGEGGYDILVGGADNDILLTSTTGGFMHGGSGADTLQTMSSSTTKELFIGGTGNDTLTTNGGADIIAFNSGDGQDVVAASTGLDNTVSLGGGIQYSNLTFNKSGSDLVLNTGGGERITLGGWYSSASNKSVSTLQVIAEAMAGFNPSGSDTLLDNKVERFDFAALAAAFDSAGQVNGWALTNALLASHLGGADDSAVGGDLTYQYGLNGNFNNVGSTGAQNVLSNGSFGTGLQTFQSAPTLAGGTALGA